MGMVPPRWRSSANISTNINRGLCTIVTVALVIVSVKCVRQGK